MTVSETAVADEDVVLCAQDGTAAGRFPKRLVHHRNTPLHLAFSCYLFDSGGRFLVTTRAFGKLTWPGVRTNSCCGHPAPEESMRAAITRRLGQELGVAASEPRLVLPRFSYRAEMADGTVEYELCPVYVAVADTADVRPDPAEVHAADWMAWGEFAAGVRAGTEDVSPWCALQVAELAPLGQDPAAWPSADPAHLPAAARH